MSLLLFVMCLYYTMFHFPGVSSRSWHETLEINLFSLPKGLQRRYPGGSHGQARNHADSHR